MTFYEALQKEKRWWRRALIISVYHHRMCNKRKWTMRDTAEKLKISLGHVSESIRLAKAVADNDRMENMTRQEALYYVSERR